MNNFEVLKTVKSILCPVKGYYHPVEKCAECSHCVNKTIQVLTDGAALDYILCSHRAAVLPLSDELREKVNKMFKKPAKGL